MLKLDLKTFENTWLRTIEKESELKGKIVRPLSGGLLAKTDAEKEGLIKRENLGMIRGRQRKIQMKMAKEYGIENPPNAGGGCLLTEPQFGIKAKEYSLNFHWDKIIKEYLKLL